MHEIAILSQQYFVVNNLLFFLECTFDEGIGTFGTKNWDENDS